MAKNSAENVTYHLFEYIMAVAGAVECDGKAITCAAD